MMTIQSLGLQGMSLRAALYVVSPEQAKMGAKLGSIPVESIR
jgi:hypothetical protein